MTEDDSNTSADAAHAPGNSSVGKPQRLRRSLRIGDYLAAIALVINGVGIYIITVQIEQANQSIRSNTLEQVYGRMHDINKFFVDHPELKPYFYENLPVDGPNPLIDSLNLNGNLVRAQVPPLAETLCDFFAQALMELKQLPPGAYEGWRSYIEDVYKSSPAMRDYYHKNAAWYQYKEADEIFRNADIELAAQAEKNEEKAAE